MDPITSSQKNSALLSNLSSVTTSSLFNYSLTKNAPSFSSTVIAVSPNVAPSANPVNQSMSFKVPTYGLISAITLSSSLTTGADNSGAQLNLGERIASSISLRSHNKELCNQFDVGVHVAGANMGFEKALSHKNLVNSATSWNATSATFFTPVYYPFFDKTGNYIDASFIEGLEVVVDINSLAKMGLTQAITGSDFKLYIEYISLSNEDRETYMSSQFPSNEPLIMYVQDEYVERKAIADNALTTTLDCKFNGVVSSISCFIQDATTSKGTDTAFSDLSFKCSGRSILNAIPVEILQAKDGRMGVTGLNYVKGTGAITKPALRPTNVWFGQSPDNSWNSGAVALGQLSTPQVQITHLDIGATKELVVVYKYMKLLVVSPNTGVIDVGLSN